MWVGLAQGCYVTPDIAPPEIFEYIQKAVELDPNLPDLHYTLGVKAVWTEWDWEKGEKEFLQSLAINPNDAMTRMDVLHHLTWL